MAYKIMQHLNSDMKDVAEKEIVSKKEFLKYFKSLWFDESLETVAPKKPNSSV